jgi:hypothetical protein
MFLRPLLVALVVLASACARTPVIAPAAPTFGIEQQQETLLRWLEGDFKTTTSEGRDILWRIRKIPDFRAMIYMERFVDGSTTPDRQELWYLEPPSVGLGFQSWRHVRPQLFAGATGDPKRLATEYIYDMRRNEELNLSAVWQEGQFLIKTIQPAPPTGPAGHPDSRPILTMTVKADQIMRAEQFMEGTDAGTALIFERVPPPE